MQAQFDKLVEEFSKDSTIDDAIREAIECMQESGSNLDTVFLYENSIELTEKIKMEAKYITIEKASRQQESFVNATFAMQGMKQILCGSESDKVTIGSWKLIESRNFFHSVLNLIPPLEDDDNANEGKMIDEEDSDEDEDEEATNAVIIQSLQFACMLLRSGMSVNHRIRDPQNTFSVDSERFQFLCAKFDEVMSAPEVLVAFLDFFHILLARPENRELFSVAGGVALLDLARKMNKSHSVIPAQVAYLLAEFYS